MSSYTQSPERGAPSASAPLPLLKKPTGYTLERHDSAPLPTTHKSGPRGDSIWVAHTSSHSFFFANDSQAEGEDASRGLKGSHVCVNLVKCAIGAGSFSFPAAFVSTGMGLGTFSLVAMALTAAYTMTMLADAEKEALQAQPQPLMDEDSEKQLRPQPAPVVRMTYPEVMKALFPELVLFGRNLSADLVNFFIILTSVLVSIVYLLFIADVFHKDPFNVDPVYILLSLLLPVGALAQLRSFKYLAFTSVLGDVAVTAGIVGTVVIGLTRDAPGGVSRDVSWPSTDVIKFVNDDFKDVSTGIATISFLFLVHIMTLPMAQSLHRDREEPKSWHSVAWISYLFIGGLNLVFTLLAVCIFWDDGPASPKDPPGIQSPITNNLGGGAAPAAVKVLLCVDLLFTIPMILSVGREVIENAVLPPEKQDHGKNAETIRTVIRACMVVVVLGLATGGAKSSGVNKAFNDAIGLVGGLTNTTVGLIVPPFAYHRAKKSGWGPGRLGGLLISAVGLALLCTSTYFTMKDIVNGK